MKNLIAISAVVTALATSASAATVGWGFKSVANVTDGATEITWTGGSVQLIQTDNLLTVEITGLNALPVPTDPTKSGLVAWVADWAAPMGLWNTFDLYLRPAFNTHCSVLITPFMRDFQDGSVGDYVWDNPTGQGGGGHCINNVNNVTVTAQLAPVPLPAGALLLLTGVAGLGMMRRKR